MASLRPVSRSDNTDTILAPSGFSGLLRSGKATGLPLTRPNVKSRETWFLENRRSSPCVRGECVKNCKTGKPWHISTGTSVQKIGQSKPPERQASYIELGGDATRAKIITGSTMH